MLHILCTSCAVPQQMPVMPCQALASRRYQGVCGGIDLITPNLGGGLYLKHVDGGLQTGPVLPACLQLPLSLVHPALQPFGLLL